jgi:nitrate/nitrite-specific signal transduction histidine kinase
MALLSQRTIANPIRRLTNVAEQIRGGDLDAQAKVESRDEIGTLATTFNNMTSQLRRTLLQVRKEKRRADDLLEVVIPIGVELTTEKDFNRLLEKMLLEAKNFCRADSGLLYLLTDHNTLNHAIVRNDSLNMIMGGTSNIAVSVPDLAMVGPDGSVQRGNVAVKTAIDGVSINLSEGQGIEAYQASLGEDPCLKGYAVKSLLSIPLRNPEKVLGVMLLINPQDAETKNVIPFDANLQQMMESFSSLAVAALEAYIREQALRAEVAQLRIEIDKAKQQKAVDEIVDTDFFRNLEAKARSMRNRSRGTSGSPA